MSQKTEKREAVLKAAGQIVLSRGVENLTLDAVAKQAGVSKGGLLYHFPTKEALVEGMAEHLIREFDDLIEQKIEREVAVGEAPEAGRWLRAYVRVNTAPPLESSSISAALMAAIPTNPKALAATDEAFERWRQRAESDGVSLEMATLVRLAADGCWFYSMYGSIADARAQEYLETSRQRLLSVIAQDVAGKGG